MRLAILLSLGLLLGSAGCRDRPEASRPIVGGDPERGRREIARLQCGACHVIPGIAAPRGSAGPPLDGFASRVHLAGKWPNEPRYLLSWLRDPPAMAPRTAMPALVGDDDAARDIAAYLYTLD